MPGNQHHHSEPPQGSGWTPSWVPPENPYYAATEPPRKSGAGKKVLIGVLIAVALAVVAGSAAVAVFLSDSSRTTSGAAESTVVQTVTEFVDPPADGAGQLEGMERPADPQLPGGATAVSSEALNGEPAGGFRNVYTGSSVTSAPFAEAVGQAWRAHHDSTGELNATITAHSPVTGTSYSMQCSDSGSYVICTGGNNAVVYLA